MDNALILAIQLLVSALPVHARINGVVRDAETSQPLPGASVTLVDAGWTAVTDSAGRYSLTSVPSGQRRITIRLIGYEQRSLEALVPPDGALEIDIVLEPRPVPLDPFEVQAPLSIRGVEAGSTSSFPDREISSTAISNHPTLWQADAFQALGGGEVVLDPESPDGVHIRGGASDQTAYLVDGIPVFSPYHAAGMFSAWNPDAMSRLSLSPTGRESTSPNTLSGAIEGFTRSPSDHLSFRGGVSTTQARLTVDGPLPATPGGFLFSTRSGVHDVLSPDGDPSYLGSETGDWLAKVESNLPVGRLRFVGYGNADEIDAASTVEGEPVERRNDFRWRGRSFGATWEREAGPTSWNAQAWSADGDVDAEWASVGGAVAMQSDRRDQGLTASVERRSAQATSFVELRVERSRTSYRVDSDSVSDPLLDLRSTDPVATVLVRQQRPIAPRLDLDVAVSLAAMRLGLFPGTRTRLRWCASDRLSVSGTYIRSNQFAQSMRNPESVVGHIFPPDLYVGAGAPGVDVARGDQGVLGIEARPRDGFRVGVQGYARRSTGLVLVAPREGEPFSTGGFLTGTGVARGMSVDAAASANRWGMTASYGLQRVRYAFRDSSYVPSHGTQHLVEGGVVVLPTRSSSIRVGASMAFGRRALPVANGLEWETNNLVDHGSEFAGSPHYAGLNGLGLPSYVRLDVGVRRSWRFDVAGRDAAMAVFGTYSNLLGRRNVLTYVRHGNGTLGAVELVPSSPVVVGLDWRF